MSTGRAEPATPEQILMFGHIATALRKIIDDRGWKAGDFNQAMGLKRSNTAIYQFLNGKMAPGPEARIKISKMFGIPIEQLTPQRLSDKPSAIVTYKPSKSPIIANYNRPSDVLSFAVTADGNARLKLDVVLSLDKATPLLRMLLDAGLVFLPGDDNDNYKERNTD
jgi:transcriptional regulator with XRE-family HTH domain